MKQRLVLICTLLLILLCGCTVRTELKYLETSVTHEYIGAVTLRSEMEYDEAGNQTAFIQYRDGEEFSRITYTHTDGEILGEITQGAQAGTIRQVYEQDADGNITRLEMYVDNELYSLTESTYDTNGNVLTSVQKTIPGDITTTTTYVYDENSNPIRVTYDFDGAGTVTENSYDSAGRLVSAVTYDLLGHLTARKEHTWNEAGVELVSTYNPADERTETIAKTYDEAGNLLTAETYGPEGNLTLRTTYTYQKIKIPVK